MNDSAFEALLKARIKAHKVGFTVEWELPAAEFGTTRYLDAKGEDAKHLVIERLLSGQPVEVQFFEDIHDFGDGDFGSVTCERGPPPWDVLRMVADQLEAQDEACAP